MYDDEPDTHELTRAGSETLASDVALTTQIGIQQTMVQEATSGGGHCVDEADRC
jgi:hypothetical protein